MKHLFYFLFVLSVVAPGKVYATKSSMPLDVEMTIDEAMPIRGTTVHVTLRVTPRLDATHVTINLTTQGSAVLAKPVSLEFKDWQRDDTRIFHAVVTFAKPEQAMIRTDINMATATYPPFGIGRELDFITDDDRLFYSQGGYIGAEQARIAYDLRAYLNIRPYYDWRYRQELRKVLAR